MELSKARTTGVTKGNVLANSCLTIWMLYNTGAPKPQAPQLPLTKLKPPRLSRSRRRNRKKRKKRSSFLAKRKSGMFCITLNNHVCNVCVVSRSIVRPYSPWEDQGQEVKWQLAHRLNLQLYLCADSLTPDVLLIFIIPEVLCCYSKVVWNSCVLWIYSATQVV